MLGMKKKNLRKQFYFIIKFFSQRMTSVEALEHKWLKHNMDETELSSTKSKLKRYVIKKRWIKAVNTIIALQRMGAKINCDLL